MAQSDTVEGFIEATTLSGVLIIRRPTFVDERGFFRETYRKNDLDKFLPERFVPVQENHSHSAKGVLRGIHVAPWYKLVQCVHGSVQQVVVDLRKDSPTFKQYISVTMGDENRVKVLIPPACGNAFLTLSSESDYLYLTTDYWSPGKEFGVIWDDQELKIDWAIKNPLLSEKDKVNPGLKDTLS